MDNIEVIAALAALAQSTRLDTFRLLVEREPDGVPAGELARLVEVPQNTMSAHLAILARARLIVGERHSRSIVYRASLARFREVALFLLKDCCGGRADLCAPLIADLTPCAHPRRPLMAERIFNVLFLCTGNSGRSILAEAILRKDRRGPLRRLFGGQPPQGRRQSVRHKGAGKAGVSDRQACARRDWEEFSAPGAPTMDFVFTLCDDAAREACPVWPGQPMTAHWGIEDPAAVEGTDIRKEAAFVAAARYVRNRISAFVEPADQEPRQVVADREAARDRDARRRDQAPPRGRVMDAIIYHNPACGTSRNVLAMIRNSGVEPHIIEYLKCPPTRLLLTQLLARAGLTVREILREKGTPFHDLGLGDPSLSDDALLDAIGAHPILMNRPLVVTPKGVRLCRPSEKVLDLCRRNAENSSRKTASA